MNMQQISNQEVFLHIIFSKHHTTSVVLQTLRPIISGTWKQKAQSAMLRAPLLPYKDATLSTNT